MPEASVAVIDIGSNSIKVLVAARAADGSVAPLKTRTIDARIGAGLGKAEPQLSEQGMTRGVEAIRELLADAAAFSPSYTRLVATSAVRDARNGDEFRARVRTATGHEIRILSGAEEANLIGRGLTCDPALQALGDFYVFDLGGGSLECLAFRARRVEQAVSLQLGCVRLTEKFLPEPDRPFPLLAQMMIATYTRELVDRSGFRFSLPAAAMAIGTGGTVTTARAMLHAQDDTPLDATPAIITVPQMATLLAKTGGLPLTERKKIAGLPPARADVFPTALATLLGIADLGKFPSFHNSLYNLRYGLAAEMLGLP